MVPCFVRIHLGLFSIELVNGQALLDFLVDHPSLEIGIEQSVELGIYGAEKEPWIFKFDGSSAKISAEARIVIISPRKVRTTLPFNLAFECTNNQAEYEALVIGLEILLDLGAKDVLSHWRFSTGSSAINREV